MPVVPLPPRGEWLPDIRDGGRALRVSWHAELGCVVLSSWRGDACVGTVRLAPEDAARLVGVLAHGLATVATPPLPDGAAPVPEQAATA